MSISLGDNAACSRAMTQFENDCFEAWCRQQEIEIDEEEELNKYDN